MTAWFPSFVAETLVWTGLLIVLVLLIRRPVGRYFGPRAAYALWLLPALRLIMPPLVLPAWLAPASHQSGAETVEMTASAAELANMAALDGAATAQSSMALPISWIMALLAIWLIGAAIFMAVRYSSYFRMRRDLLAGGSPVGDVEVSKNLGPVRLVETPTAAAPLALGVVDKVIVLPAGFMALNNREERDFALAHELAHHAGHDLLANMAVQPLFALHWFTPLAWLGWRAMRRDQEAACDARVIASRSAADKAAYAHTIASFAAGPHVSLAAPMTCPVLGEKSIIHRLRSISMSDISPRRRFAGRALIAASLLALPTTASISYAEVISQEAPNEAAPAAVEADATYVPPVVIAADTKATFTATPKVKFTANPETESSEKPKATFKKNDAAEAEKPKYTFKISKEKLEAFREKLADHPNHKLRYQFDESKLTPEQREQIQLRLRELQDDTTAANQLKRRIFIAKRATGESPLVQLIANCKADEKSGELIESNGRQVIQVCSSNREAEDGAVGAFIVNPGMSQETRAKVLAILKDRLAVLTKTMPDPAESITAKMN